MSTTLGGQNKAKALPRAALVLLVLILAMLTWLPHLMDATSDRLGRDMLFEQTAQKILCGVGPITGWPINNDSIGERLGTFAPTLPGYLVARASCAISDVVHISGLQAFLIVSITLTVLITFGASRAVGLGLRPALLISYGLATAPCSFSRFGHLQLSQLWPIMPCIAVCALLLTRDQYPIKPEGWLYRTGSFGLAMGIFSFTAQEYYAVFSILWVCVFYAAGAALAARSSNSLAPYRETKANSRPSTVIKYRYAKIAAGYATAMLLFLSSKQLLWRIPGWALQATERSSVEQFMYSFWPSNILTSPLVNNRLRAIFEHNGLPLNETPFKSSSGILVVTGLGIALACWMKTKRNADGAMPNSEGLIMAFGGVLVASIGIACLVATSGGMGTLFAVFISPQLRALNRITPYFYCAALVVCAIRLDQIIAAVIKNRKRGAQS